MANKLLIIIAFVAFTSMAFIGCDGHVEITLFSVTGDVVDARSEFLAGVGNVSVTFTKVDGGSSQVVTTSSDGSYNLEYEGQGEYKIEARKTGWFFIPQTVYIGNWRTNVPEILGIQLDDNPDVRDNAISFILTWNDTYKDLDGSLTFPDGSGIGDGFEGSHSPASSNDFSNPYSPAPGPSVGFGPDISAREVVGPAHSSLSLNTISEIIPPGTDNRPAVELDRDDRDGAGPEVITVRTLPFWPSDYDTTADYTVPYDSDSTTDTRLPEEVNSVAVSWTWIGVMEYYVDGWDANSATTNLRDENDEEHLISVQGGTGADAMLHIIQGSTLLGAYKVPDYADFRTASLVRVNMFLGKPVDINDDYQYYFQFVPDIRLVDFDDGYGIMSANADSSPIFGAFGALR